MLKASFLHQEGISTRIFLKLKIAGHLTLGAVFLAPEKKSSNGGHMQENLLTVSGGNMGAYSLKVNVEHMGANSLTVSAVDKWELIR